MGLHRMAKIVPKLKTKFVPTAKNWLDNLWPLCQNLSVKFSRSQINSFQTCPRKYWYEYVQGLGTNRGLEPKAPNLPLTMGLAVHKGMEVLFKLGGNLDSAIDAGLGEWKKATAGKQFPFSATGTLDHDSFLQEQEALITAFLWAWRVQFWDEFNNQYEVVQIEQELETEIRVDPIQDGWNEHWPDKAVKFILQSRCDLVVRRREDGAVIIPDWKCVTDARDWQTRFALDAQTWAQSLAVSSALDEPIVSCLYFAFIKGGRKNGEYSSPLIYGYKQQLDSGHYQYSHSYKKGQGWSKFAVWNHAEFGKTVKDRIRFWVNWLPEEVRAAQFCQTEEILPDPQLQSDWLRDAINVVRHTRDNAENIAAFPRHPNYFNCRKCWVRDVCSGETQLESKLEDGSWISRRDHHAVEGTEE